MDSTSTAAPDQRSGVRNSPSSTMPALAAINGPVPNAAIRPIAPGSAAVTGWLKVKRKARKRIGDTSAPVVMLGQAPEGSGLHEAVAPQDWLSLLGPGSGFRDFCNDEIK